VVSPLLIFGVGPFPRLEMVGAGVALGTFSTVAASALILYMQRAGTPLRLARHRLEWRNFREILGVGGLSALGTVQANLTVALVTGAVGRFASDAIAGYGIASRLDYLLIPLLFGFGTAVVTLVGRNVGAGRPDRALRIAWIGAGMAGAMTGVIGLLAALFAPQWARLFTTEPAVVETATLYLRIVAPFYGVFGVGMTLYFAAQGARRVGWPVAAGTFRLLVAGVFGALATAYLGLSLSGLFSLVAASTLVFGGVIAASLFLKPWSRPSNATQLVAPRRRVPSASRSTPHTHGDSRFHEQERQGCCLGYRSVFRHRAGHGTWPSSSGLPRFRNQPQGGIRRCRRHSRCWSAT
jgi:Na+-driven multidrug efflux pump